MRLERNQLSVRLGEQIYRFGRVGFAMREFIDATAGPMDPIVIMAFAGIAPIRDVDSAILPCDQIHPAKPRIGYEAEVGSTLADIASPLSLQEIAIDAEAVQV